MATILLPKDIAEKSLERIGRFPTSQDQADAVDLKRALSSFELVLQELAGFMSVTCLREIITIQLAAEAIQYALVNFVLTEDVQFLFSAEVLEVASGAVSPVRIVDEAEFSSLNQNTFGKPEVIFMDRSMSPLVHVWPVLGPQVPDNTYNLQLHVQHFFSPVDTKTGLKKQIWKLRPSWYIWAINRLAYHLGTGTIRRLPKSETDDFKRDYEEAQELLNGFDNDQTDNHPFTEPWGQDPENTPHHSDTHRGGHRY